MKEKIKEAVKALAAKAKGAPSSLEAMQFSQAVSNLVNSLMAIENNERNE